MDTEAQRRSVWCELVQEVAGAQGEVRLRAGGASMLPTVWPGDLVTVRGCDLADLRPGQIILHRRQQNLTLHRIVRVASDHLITRGDSLLSFDPPVKASDVLGQVVSIRRSGRSVRIEQAPWQRVVAWILRRSRLLRRGTAYVHRHVWKTGETQGPVADPTALRVGGE